MLQLLGRFAPVIFLLVLMLVFALLEPRFLHPINLFNVMRQISITGLIAIGMTFVILTAGIDLSVGSMLALAGLVAAAVAKGGLSDRFTVGAIQEAAGHGWPLAMLAALGVGLACGFVQGLAITRLKVPPFVVTLGGLSAFRGAALLFAGGGPISGFDAPTTPGGARARSAPVPVPGDHLSRLCRPRPRRAALHPLRPARLRGRRQSRGGAARRPERAVGSRSRSTSSSASSPGSPASCSRRA